MPAQFTNVPAVIDRSEASWRALDVAIAMTKAAGGSLAVLWAARGHQEEP